MSKRYACTVLPLLILAACGQADGEDEAAESMATMDIAEPAAAPMPPEPRAADAAAQDAAEAMEEGSTGSTGSITPIPGTSIPVGMPQIAYSYSFGFRLPAAAIKPLQERHADMCEAKGPNSCRIVAMEQADDEGDYSEAHLTLAIAAPIARRFGKDLVAASDRAEGELVASGIEGEDLSKQIVDTEARLRARRVLRDRLMEVLETRKGTVAELVEAEHGVAQVNEEIDQATSWLAEMKNRVAYSTMTITYQSGAPSAGGFADPIRDAWGAIGRILGTLIGILIVAVAVLLPLGLFVWLVVFLLRRLRLSTVIGGRGWLPEKRAEDESL